MVLIDRLEQCPTLFLSLIGFAVVGEGSLKDFVGSKALVEMGSALVHPEDEEGCNVA